MHCLAARVFVEGTSVCITNILNKKYTVMINNYPYMEKIITFFKKILFSAKTISY